MSSDKERVCVVGASGDVDSGVVRGLVSQGIDTTAYVRNEQKANDLFKDELKTNHLTIVIGTYSSVDVFAKAIQGHSRLFLLVAPDPSGQATSMGQIKETFGKIAFEAGVRQIVDLSSASVSSQGRKGIIGYAHTTAEEKLWTLADQKPEQRSLVVLRPGSFMSYHLQAAVYHIKQANKFLSCGHPASTLTWIDTKDIADCAVVVLSESVEKHDRIVYQMGSETLSNEQRAAVFSKVLGRTITYEQQSIKEFYTTLIGYGVPHSAVYDLVSIFTTDTKDAPTPQISLLLGRPLRSFEDWLIEHVTAFE